MDIKQIETMVKRDMRHAAEMLVQASEETDTLEEMNLVIQSVRQIIQHDAALIGMAMQERDKASGA